jgi:hypothetical protein
MSKLLIQLSSMNGFYFIFPFSQCCINGKHPKRDLALYIYNFYFILSKKWEIFLLKNAPQTKLQVKMRVK